MSTLDPKFVQQGADAEARFRAWLDDSRLPHIYADQSRESVPQHFLAQLKRPDYLVALPFVGTVAFDVKCKTTYGRQAAYVFDVPEIRRLANFDRLFRITTFFACLAPSGADEAVWFQVEDLMILVGRRFGGVVRVRAADGLAVDMGQPFQNALRDAISLV